MAYEANPGREPLLGELIAVLRSHPRGLRRWSVMRAMRENRKRQSRDIPHKFEEDIERIFRRYCAENADTRICAIEDAPFYRPRDTAGEVWALYPERAEALLAEPRPAQQPTGSPLLP
jgi:hypothetical protein